MHTDSSTLVSELRTSNLGPKQYYELYMAVFDALRHLSVYLRESHPVNHLADLYELVQYAGNIVPRLYLMITVGTVYMAIEDAPVKEIMKDMMEMSRGIQHPIRGLFLRYYLSGQVRDCLPQGTGNGPEGNVEDSIHFVLTNFVEMNKLWVRLQHQGHSREREQRTKERQELQLLVGSNLVRLSQLVDLDAYKETILQPLLEQVVQCRDVLAQEYLLEVITQVFPDEFHLNTLDQLLAAITRLNPHVNIKAIVIGLMDRLSSYSAREAESKPAESRKQMEEEATARLMEKLKMSDSPHDQGNVPRKDQEVQKLNGNDGADGKGPTSESSQPDGEHEASGQGDDASTLVEGQNGDTASTTAEDRGDPSDKDPVTIPSEVQLYEIFYHQVTNLVQVQRLHIQDTMALLVSLSNMALNIYPDRLDYVDQVLMYASEKAAQFANSADLHSPQTQSHILQLLLAPIKAYFSLFTALALPNFLPLLQAQTYLTRRAVAVEVARNLLDDQTQISTPSEVDGVFGILRVLIREGTQQSSGYPGGPSQRRGAETEETIQEQGWLARVVHLIKSAENDVQFQLLEKCSKAFAEGNERIKFTTPALLTSALRLARKYKTREHLADNWSTQSTNLYKFMHKQISALYTRVNGAADLCLRLFVSCGQVADQCGFEEMSYEFFAQAFTIYEESISDSRAQFQAVCVIASALHSTRNFGKENYDTLITKCALHGSKLLKKPDQCRAVYLASHLWWATELREKPDDDTSKVSYLCLWGRRSLTQDSYTATESASLNVSSEHYEWQTHVWTLRYLWSSLSRS